MYQFILDGVMLPVAPGQLKVKIKNNDDTVTLINEGDVSILKTPGLTEISFSALLPSTQHPFAQYPDGFQPAQYYLEKLKGLKNGCLPFHFQVLREGAGKAAFFQTDFLASLEQYEIEEDAEKYGADVMVSVSLKEYRGYGTKVVKLEEAENGETSATVEEPREAPPQTGEGVYIVKSGDSLWVIAKQKLGDGTRYAELYSLNEEVIEAAARAQRRDSSSRGKWIYPGTVLRLPAQ